MTASHAQRILMKSLADLARGQEKILAALASLGATADAPQPAEPKPEATDGQQS